MDGTIETVLKNQCLYCKKTIYNRIPSFNEVLKRLIIESALHIGPSLFSISFYNFWENYDSF
jgi:hypothetical protein